MRVCGKAVSIVVTDTGMFYPQMIHIGTKKTAGDFDFLPPLPRSVDDTVCSDL